jgi:hypothetical protein
VRDLKIRVANSGLHRADELARELEALSQVTKLAARGYSRLTAKTRKTVDTVASFDDYAANALLGIAERRNASQTLPGRIINALQPYGAWDLIAIEGTEQQVKDVFLFASTRITSKVQDLLVESRTQWHHIEEINVILERIKELCRDELGDIPKLDILSALWQWLARHDDYKEQKANLALLKDLTKFYISAEKVMEHTTKQLNRFEAELEEFRDDFASPGLILKDYPLEFIVGMWRKAGKRLEGGIIDTNYISAP